MTERGPELVKQLLSELITLRGWARSRGSAQLQTAWRAIAGESFWEFTSAVAIRNGVLSIHVANASLLSELVSFHKQNLLQALQSRHPELRIRDLKFKLDSSLSSP